jgi:hypothetical protein
LIMRDDLLQHHKVSCGSSKSLKNNLNRREKAGIIFII